MPTNLELSFAPRPETFSVRSFRVQAALSTLFQVSILAASELDDADLDGLAGSDARFAAAAPASAATARLLEWTGVCSQIELVQAESKGLSTYHLTLVPRLWLLGLRTSCRVMQRMTGPEMAEAILREWGIELELRLDPDAHPKLDYRVQYNETDLSFVSRMLEEAGVSYFFRTVEGTSRLVLSDRPGSADARSPIPFAADASTAGGRPHATHVHRTANLRPGAYRVRDYDFTNPPFELFGQAGKAGGAPPREVYQHVPGASVAVTGPEGATAADDHGEVSADGRVLSALAERRLDAARATSRALSFQTNVFDLAPGSIAVLVGHPRSDLGPEAPLLVAASTFEGGASDDWTLVAHAFFAGAPFRPPLATPKPRILGPQSATVVGPKGEDIHTDQHGRVRVLFPWDREGARGDGSSCWVRVSQGAAGMGFGLVSIPRVGEEVLVAFLDGDPDQPVVVGRLFNATHLHPYPLPREKAVSGWKTQSSPRGGHNELRFDDREGAELVHLRAERHLDESVVADHLTHVGNERRLTIGAGRSVQVGAGDRLVVGGDRGVRIEGSASHEVGGSARAVIGGARITSIAADESLTVGRNVFVTAGEMVHVIAGTDEPSDAVIQASGSGRVFSHDTLHLQSPTSVEITCGTTRLVLTPDGITLRAKHVRLEGTEDVVLVHEASRVRVADSVEVTSQSIALEASGSSVALDAKAQIKGSQVQLGGSASAGGSASDEPGVPGRATIRVVAPEGHEGPLTVRIALPSGEVIERETSGGAPIVLEGQPGERFTVLDVHASGGALRWGRA